MATEKQDSEVTGGLCPWMSLRPHTGKGKRSMTPESKRVLFEVQDGVVTVTINNPSQRNALDQDIQLELQKIFTDLRDDERAKVVVLTGAGENFCAGGNLVKMQSIRSSVAGRDRMKRSQRLVQSINALEKPVIAMVRGIAVGAGMSLALSADITIAAEDARLMCVFSKLGLVPDWGQLHMLPSRIGLARTKYLMMTGGEMSGAEAERLGLIALAVPGERLEEEVYGLAKKMARGATRSYGLIKTALNSWPASFSSLLELEATMQGVAFLTEDHAEARQAFIEKRKPRFKGK